MRQSCPMPQKDRIQDSMHGCEQFRCFDRLSGYHQIRMREKDIPYTAFQTPNGLFEYLVIPMGLCNAPASQEAEIEAWVKKMLKVGLIRPSMSPHGAPTFCVKKSGGEGWRIVHDYIRNVVNWAHTSSNKCRRSYKFRMLTPSCVACVPFPRP